MTQLSHSRLAQSGRVSVRVCKQGDWALKLSWDSHGLFIWLTIWVNDFLLKKKKIRDSFQNTFLCFSDGNFD